MEQLLEEVERLAVLEDANGDPFAIGRAVLAEDLLAEALDERALHLGVGREQMVDDLVARDRRGAVPAKRLERRRLAGADPSGDRDRERAGQVTLVGVLLLGGRLPTAPRTPRLPLRARLLLLGRSSPRAAQPRAAQPRAAQPRATRQLGLPRLGQLSLGQLDLGRSASADRRQPGLPRAARPRTRPRRRSPPPARRRRRARAAPRSSGTPLPRA